MTRYRNLLERIRAIRGKLDSNGFPDIDGSSASQRYAGQVATVEELADGPAGVPPGRADGFPAVEGSGQRGFSAPFCTGIRCSRRGRDWSPSTARDYLNCGGCPFLMVVPLLVLRRQSRVVDSRDCRQHGIPAWIVGRGFA